MPGPETTQPVVPRWFVWLLLLGAFLTLRGYRSFEGDQAYRFPLLFHRQDPSLYRDDPFVRSFDRFNPHRGSLALIGFVSRPFGLPAGLAVLFGLTFLGTCAGVDRLTRAVWPSSGSSAGGVAVGLVLAALAGNIGTNHLFEPMVLDRQIAFSLGWVAMAFAVASTGLGAWLSTVCIGLAALVHPTVGLQLAMLLGTGWVGWLVLSGVTRVSARQTAGALAALTLALVPGLWLNMRGSGGLLDGVDLNEFRLLSVELQGPQHMLPHLWRLPQWLAWGCFLVLAAVSVAPAFPEHDEPACPPARSRLLTLLAVNLLGLGLAWLGVEWWQDLRLTLFQPFRMATIARGLCLILVAGHAVRLWRRAGAFERTRAVLIPVGLAGDWMMVAVTALEVTAELGQTMAVRSRRPRHGLIASRVASLAVLAGGIVFLSKHDTESGHVPLAAAAVVSWVGFRWMGERSIRWDRGRCRRMLAVAWALPLAAMISAAVPERLGKTGHSWKEGLARKIRLTEVPTDDIERLALWCREHTPVSARFIGPPGPKGFRLWSRRSLAFNRAASPYNARGLADWANRYQEHVGFDGDIAEFVRAYRDDRHGLERRYDRMSREELAALADRQGAQYVIAPRPAASSRDTSPLEPLHVEGRWAVYRRSGSSIPALASRAETVAEGQATPGPRSP
jgi:hypothetical protein